MSLSRFLTQREPAWRELEALLAKAGAAPERLAPADIRRLGERYREASADLARARSRWPGDPVVARLERLVHQGRGLIYTQRARGGGITGFFARDYWRLVAERPKPLMLAWALLLIGVALAVGWAVADPDAAAGLLPGGLGDLDRETARDATGVGDSSAFASQLFTHNIQVSFTGFAAGITAGIGTALLLVYNGLILGVVAGLTVADSHGRFFAELVAAHGVIEISCIVVTAAAGMRMGWALVRPGPAQTRAESLAHEARRAVLIVVGTMPWLVLAGITESAITPRLSAEAGVLYGVLVGAVYWWLVWFLGRRDGSPAVTAVPAASP